jgi:hypothetical protein
VIILFQKVVTSMAECENSHVFIRDQLPYGGAVNIRGQIVWRITKEEHDAMKARVLSLFEEDE